LKKRVYLTYPQDQIKEPLLYNVAKLFDVVTNIRQATISDTIGLVALEMDGERCEGRAHRAGHNRVARYP